MSEPEDRPAPWRVTRKFAFPALWALILGFLFLLRDNLAPFIGAVLIAYLLSPFVRLLRRIDLRGRHLPRWSAVLIIYAIAAGVTTLYLVLAVPRVGAELTKLVDEGNRFVQTLTPERIDEYSLSAKRWLEDSGLPVHLVTPRMPVDPDAGPGFVLNAEKVIRQTVADLSEGFRANFLDFLKLGPKFAADLVRKILLAFLILMVAAFLLSDPGRILNFFRSLFPPRLHRGFDEVLSEIDEGLAGVVRGQVIIALLNGVLTFIGLMVFGVKFPVLLSTLTAVLSLIPIFGSFLSAVPIVAVGLTEGLGTGMGVMFWLIGINLAEANFFNPKIIGVQAKIHPALVVFVLLAGERIYGVLGALFAVPVLSVSLAFFRVLHRRAIGWCQDDKLGPLQTCADPDGSDERSDGEQSA